MNQNKLQIAIQRILLFILYCISSGTSLYIHQNHDDDDDDEKVVAQQMTKNEVCGHDNNNNNKDMDNDNIIVPYSYSLHRNSTYQLTRRRFSFTENGGSLPEILDIDSLIINQNFRSDGTGLGSAQWDGSFVLAEVLQRLDFTKAHDYMDQKFLLLSQISQRIMSLSPQLLTLFHGVLTMNPNHRWSMDDVWRCEWMNMHLP